MFELSQCHLITDAYDLELGHHAFVFRDGKYPASGQGR